MTLEATLWALWLSAFTSATLWIGTSEAAFWAAYRAFPEHAVLIFWVAVSGNTLGSVVSWAMGRFLPERFLIHKINPKALNYLKKWGAWSLFWAWVPMVGDMLPIAAGWLRLNAWACTLMLLLGKSFRYGILWAGLDKFLI
ncbi:YqaA family protein [Alysiella crassa]|uniref:Inner membrane protein yqaA n=1 Tax=Alysiella crassa TaxID=153491 RepID=A0A376BJT2_9NEIS|nr:DedA family protein [Alysiella crassa]UOP07742.1 DedA family protein [Alysiella crassa]SSY70017.1 Inner membrane protein yqaA [Alysiella crassa]